ncbi:MAG: ROK family protein [Lawsonibacter sp.]|nr:ROK family protein [Lawsonibacter sp.]
MYYVGVDVGGTNLVAGLVNEEGTILGKISHPVDRSMSADQLCRELANLAKVVCKTGGLEDGQIEAVGVGFPGLVDNQKGMVVQTPNMPFQQTPFRAVFQEQWDIPVYLGNDANCAAIGEYWAGAAKGCSTAMVITLGTGIGGGMVVDGKLFTGYANGGMEPGHMIIHPNGLLCGCGNRGCWEQYGSASALIRLTQKEMENSRNSLLWELCEGDRFKVQGRTAFQAARQGDETARRVLSAYLQGLSIGMINLINILQPEVICLGGGISNAEDDLLLDPLRELVRKGSFDKNSPTRLVRAALGNDAGVVGAALLRNSL